MLRCKHLHLVAVGAGEPQASSERSLASQVGGRRAEEGREDLVPEGGRGLRDLTHPHPNSLSLCED